MLSSMAKTSICLAHSSLRLETRSKSQLTKTECGQYMEHVSALVHTLKVECRP